MTNTYLEAEGRSVHYGMDAFKETMDESKKSIRYIRDDVVDIMAAIYELGHQPPSPKKEVDGNVARILNDSCLTLAAQAAATSVKFTEATWRREHKAESSKAAVARSRREHKAESSKAAEAR